MASKNFNSALKEVLKHEGGFVNHPQDPGGATNKGITIATYRKWVDRDGTIDDLKRITDDQVSKVYRSVYWNAIKGDDLPSGVDYAVFDFAVNSGPNRAAKYLQAVLGVTQDGKIGPVTLEAAKKADASTLIDALCDRRMAFLKSLKTFDTFGKGWTRRVDEVREKATTLAAKPSIVLEPAPHLGPHTPPDAPLEKPKVEVWTPEEEDDKKSNAGLWILIVFGLIIAAVIAFFTLPIG